MATKHSDQPLVNTGFQGHRTLVQAFKDLSWGLCRDGTDPGLSLLLHPAIPLSHKMSK